MGGYLEYIFDELSYEEILSEVLGISTSKIDRMTDAAVKHGAERENKMAQAAEAVCLHMRWMIPGIVKKAIEAAGGEAFIINTDEGSREEPVRTKCHIGHNCLYDRYNIRERNFC